MRSLIELAKRNLDGADWYSKAQAEIAKVCAAESWDIERFTAILAVTSPRVSVRRNIRIALQYVGAGELLSNVMRNIGAAIRTYETRNKILGKKTSAFFAALMGDNSAVVLDIHMANLFRVAPYIFTIGKRQKYVNRVCRVADAIRLPPRETQACLWYGQKRRVDEIPIGFPIVEEYRNWIEHDRRFHDSGTIDSRVAMPLFDNLPF
jgi:hypothetical protein